MTQDTISQIPLSQLRESPHNSRQQFNGLDELAANIKAEGKIHQPLLVRPITPNPLRDDIVEGFEIVFGHRRFRAAALAGLEAAPCMVRAMSDAEVRSAQAAENLQRENIHAFEEAQGYADIIEKDGISADTLAERVGKSRSHVYSRLKLLQATAEIRQAGLAGEIGAEVALLVARLRTEKLQQKALAAIRADTSSSSNMKDGGQRTFRHLRDLLAEKFTLDLKAAIFDGEDATLLPDAGVCSVCPKRTANAPEFADLAAPDDKKAGDGGYWHRQKLGPNICTDPDCFDAKKQAHLAREAGKLQAAGAFVVTGNKARAAISATGEVKGDFIALADVKRAIKGSSTKAADLPVVTIQDPRTGKTVQAVKKFDLVAKGVMKAKDAKATNHQGSYSAQQQKQAEERAHRERKAAEATKRFTALLLHVRQAAAGRTLGVFELRMAAAAALAGVQYEDVGTLLQLHGVEDKRQLQAAIDTMEPHALTGLLVDCLLVDGVRVNEWRPEEQPRPLLALAAHYGIDADAVMQASAPPLAKVTSTPSTAGASADKASAARAKKLAVSVKPAARGVKYRNPATGETWTGKGLRPAWLKAALAAGNALADYAVTPAKEGKEVKDKARSAGKNVKDDAGDSVARDARQLDMLATAGVGS